MRRGGLDWCRKILQICGGNHDPRNVSGSPRNTKDLRQSKHSSFGGWPPPQQRCYPHKWPARREMMMANGDAVIRHFHPTTTRRPTMHQPAHHCPAASVSKYNDAFGWRRRMLAGQDVLISPCNVARTAAVFRGPGTEHTSSRALMMAGIVSVNACVGTAASVGKQPSFTCC